MQAPYETATNNSWLTLALGLTIAVAGGAIVWFSHSESAGDATAPERRVSDPYRLDVKLTMDSEAGTIATEPLASTLPRLLRTPPGTGAGRERPLERQIWRVEATVTAVTFRPDGDLVLDIGADGATATAELPDPALCKGSRFCAQIAAARDFVIKNKRGLVGHRASLCGVGFRGLPSPGNRSGVRIYPLLAVAIETAK